MTTDTKANLAKQLAEARELLEANGFYVSRHVEVVEKVAVLEAREGPPSHLELLHSKEGLR